MSVAENQDLKSMQSNGQQPAFGSIESYSKLKPALWYNQSFDGLVAVANDRLFASGIRTLGHLFADWYLYKRTRLRSISNHHLHAYSI